MKESNPEEDVVNLNLGRIPGPLQHRLNKYAKAKGLTRTAAARMLIIEGLDRHEADNPPKGPKASR